MMLHHVPNLTGWSALLIALALGFIVFLNASKEQGGLKVVGQIIGTAIVLATIILGVLRIFICGAYILRQGKYLSEPSTMQGELFRK